MEIPTDSSHFLCTPGNPCATPIVTRGEGSFSYQGVSTRGVRHAPAFPSFKPRKTDKKAQFSKSWGVGSGGLKLAVIMQLKIPTVCFTGPSVFLQGHLFPIKGSPIPYQGNSQLFSGRSRSLGCVCPGSAHASMNSMSPPSTHVDGPAIRNANRGDSREPNSQKNPSFHNARAIRVINRLKTAIRNF